jgi:4-hydroxybenzoate polyprenyltransferase
MIKMASLKNKIKAYLRLIRIHTIIATALTPSLGAFATFTVLEGALIPWDKIPIIVSLFFVGIIVHVFGQILNDYMDYDIDKANIELSKKPLVSGDISKTSALLGLIISFIFLIIIVIFSQFTLLSLLLLSIAAASGIIYQIISKKWLHSAVFLGLYIFFIVLFGGVYAGKFDTILEVPPLVYIICVLGFFNLWVGTAILGHLKDIKNDAEYGVVTFPMRLGVKVEGQGKTPRLIIPMNFRVMVILIETIHLIVAFIPIIFYEYFYDGSINVFLLFFSLILLSLVIIGSHVKIMWCKLFERNKLMKLMAVLQIAAYFVGIVLLAPFMGWILVLIYIFLPLVWFFISNLVYTRDPMQAAI